LGRISPKDPLRRATNIIFSLFWLAGVSLFILLIVRPEPLGGQWIRYIVLLFLAGLSAWSIQNTFKYWHKVPEYR
jgi:hypothetical protein